MKKMHVAVLTLVAVLGAGLLPAAAQSGDAGVDQLAADYSDAWARGDAEALANLHTEDAIPLHPGGRHDYRTRRNPTRVHRDPQRRGPRNKAHGYCWQKPAADR